VEFVACAVIAATTVVLWAGAVAGAARATTPPFVGPACPAQLRPNAKLSRSRSGDRTFTVKQYYRAHDTRGGEITCGYFDSLKVADFSWTLHYLFSTDTTAQVKQAVANGFAPRGGWAHPRSSYCGVSKTVYAYVDCSPLGDADTNAQARAMLLEVELERLAAAQPGVPTTNLGSPAVARVLKINGAVAFSTDNGTILALLTAGALLKEGDEVSTGPKSSVVLAFGTNVVTLYPMAEFRIERFTRSKSLAQAQLFLTSGAIGATVPSPSSTRNDLAVVTSICTSSIGDGRVLVSVSSTGTTSVYAVRDVSYVKGLADKKTIKLRNGYMTTVAADETTTKPTKYTVAALKKITG
jgi:hypothetical protein